MKRRSGASRAQTVSNIPPIVDRPPLRWPNGARVALWVIPNIEHFLFDRPSTSITAATASLVPDVLNYSWRDYGVRVGIWRMMEVMQRHGVKGTVALNSDVCREYPRIIEAGKQLGWEWMGHGTNNSTLITGYAEAEERKMIQDIHRDHHQKHRQETAWLARTRAHRNPQHTRSVGRSRLRLRRRLGQ